MIARSVRTWIRHVPQTTVAASGDFAATHLDLIASIDADAATLAELAGTSMPVAHVTVEDKHGRSDEWTVTAGGAAGAQLADGALGSTMAATNGVSIAYQDVDGRRQEYRVRLPLRTPMTPAEITVSALDDRVAVDVQAATLYDERTRMFTALLPSDRGRFARVHSGDVKIYENLDLRPRTYMVTSTQAAGSPEVAAALLLARPGSTPVVVEGMAPLTGTAGTTGTVEIVSYAPEHVEVRTTSTAPAFLVLADANYPGWAATVDGLPAPIYATNVLFRGVPVPAGTHSVVFSFQPTGWLPGLWLAALGSMIVVALIAAAGWQRFRRRHQSAV